MIEAEQQLLAKRVGHGDASPHLATLLGHLQSVHASAEAVLDGAAAQMLAAFGLSENMLPRFRKIVTLAAAVHDVGKANDHFQGMITRSQARADYDWRQAVRHEWLSWWWLHQPSVRCWAETTVEEPDDWFLVACCVAGHHPKLGRATPPDHTTAGSEMIALWGHSDFELVRLWLKETFPADHSIPREPNAPIVVGQALQDDVVAEIHRQFVDIHAHVENLAWSEREEWLRICAAGKACMVASDVAGSALSEKLSDLPGQSSWIRRCLAVRPNPEDIQRLVDERLGDQDERPFQAQVGGAASRVTLVTAGCGCGKTVAAWLWAARQCAGHRVFFCYPTTGTATEGFRGYLFDEPSATSKLGSKLFHSRALVDFEVILNAEEVEHESELQIGSLQAWDTPLVCCTVDTVLGLMQNQRRGLYAWPVIAQSAFVFDEIHAYDDKLFGILLRFLQELRGVRVLLMTASLPTPRLTAIQEVLGEQEDELWVISGPAELEELPRYHREPSLDGNDISPELRQRVLNEIESGGRVLWICNIVDRAMEVADVFADNAPLIYHSRFRYEDRVEQHKAVVSAFDRSSTAGCLAVCTQVAEMSLDISATLLITEICPVPSLIQRLGRLNRHAEPPPKGKPEPPTMPFIVVERIDDKGQTRMMPYAEKTYGDWPSQTHDWLRSLGDTAISQKRLADAWELLGEDGETPEIGASTWVDGRAETQVDSPRDSSFGVTVVLPGEDAELVTQRKSEITRVGIPMPPPPFAIERERGGYIVPPANLITYSKTRGAQWNRLSASQ
jgi:CRISPR-associated endonuclease/helicase Cas3